MDLRVRSRINARQRFAQEGLAPLFDDLRDSLSQLDPLHLGKSGGSTDEYGSPVATIIPRLKNCSSPEQVEFVIEDEMRRHYPESDLTHFDSSKLSAEWLRKWREAQVRSK